MTTSQPNTLDTHAHGARTPRRTSKAKCEARGELSATPQRTPRCPRSTHLVLGIERTTLRGRPQPATCPSAAASENVVLDGVHRGRTRLAGTATRAGLVPLRRRPEESQNMKHGGGTPRDRVSSRDPPSSSARHTKPQARPSAARSVSEVETAACMGLRQTPCRGRKPACLHER